MGHGRGRQPIRTANGFSAEKSTESLRPADDDLSAPCQSARKGDTGGGRGRLHRSRRSGEGAYRIVLLRSLLVPSPARGEGMESNQRAWVSTPEQRHRLERAAQGRLGWQAHPVGQGGGIEAAEVGRHLWLALHQV